MMLIYRYYYGLIHKAPGRRKAELWKSGARFVLPPPPPPPLCCCCYTAVYCCAVIIGAAGQKACAGRDDVEEQEDAVREVVVVVEVALQLDGEVVANGIDLDG